MPRFCRRVPSGARRWQNAGRSFNRHRLDRGIHVEWMHHSKHKTFIQCWFDVGPASTTLGQLHTSIGAVSCACWDVYAVSSMPPPPSRTAQFICSLARINAEHWWHLFKQMGVGILWVLSLGLGAPVGLGVGPLPSEGRWYASIKLGGWCGWFTSGTRIWWETRRRPTRQKLTRYYTILQLNCNVYQRHQTTPRPSSS